MFCSAFGLQKLVERAVTNQSKDAVFFLANQVAKPGNTNGVVGLVIFPALAIGFRFYRVNHRFSHACHPLLFVTVVGWHHRDTLVEYYGLVSRLKL